MNRGGRSKSSPRPEAAAGYLTWSRDPAVSLFAVLPLWLLYETLRLLLAPGERNGAEVLVAQSLRALGPHAIPLMRAVFGITVLIAAWSLHRRQVPWARVAAVIALEGGVYGLMLGPASAALASSSVRFLGHDLSGRLTADLVASLGAGIFEELLFRLVLVSVLSLMFVRACELARLPRATAAVVAVIVAAIAFSFFHHIGPGAPPIETGIFLFRVAAGLLLGFLFVWRGFGVAVYTHALYDVHYYMTHHE